MLITKLSVFGPISSELNWKTCRKTSAIYQQAALMDLLKKKKENRRTITKQTKKKKKKTLWSVKCYLPTKPFISTLSIHHEHFLACPGVSKLTLHIQYLHVCRNISTSQKDVMWSRMFPPLMKVLK